MRALLPSHHLELPPLTPVHCPLYRASSQAPGYKITLPLTSGPCWFLEGTEFRNLMRSGPWQVASDLHVPDGVTVGIGGAEQVHGTWGAFHKD